MQEEVSRRCFQVTLLRLTLLIRSISPVETTMSVSSPLRSLSAAIVEEEEEELSTQVAFEIEVKQNSWQIGTLGDDRFLRELRLGCTRSRSEPAFL